MLVERLDEAGLQCALARAEGPVKRNPDKARPRGQTRWHPGEPAALVVQASKEVPCDLRSWRGIAAFNDVLTQELGGRIRYFMAPAFTPRRKSRWTLPSTLSK